ncbi:MAG: helix-turn-helix transcriptional regulator [Planctomyces sp.]|nr:helix-turn-helix transcriptional regulator [Planctomyces sp.]
MNVILQDEFRRPVTEELEKQHLSKRELARRMGVDPPYVLQYLSGRVSPGPDVMERFFRALGKTPQLILHDAVAVTI